MVTVVFYPVGAFFSFAANFNNFGNIYKDNTGRSCQKGIKLCSPVIRIFWQVRLTNDWAWSNRYELFKLHLVYRSLLLSEHLHCEHAFVRLIAEMFGREKNERFKCALWGSRIVIWITIILVLFPVVWIVMSFSAATVFFFRPLSSGKVQCGTHVTPAGRRIYCMGMESLKFCVIVATIQLGITSLAAYAFARLRLSGENMDSCRCWCSGISPTVRQWQATMFSIYRFQLVEQQSCVNFCKAGGRQCIQYLAVKNPILMVCR